jgi:HK97 family phage prohead protease
MERQTLYKSFNGGIKDFDPQKRTVVSYFASFNTKDRAKDIMVKGAFAKTIKETGPEGTREIAHLQDHNKNLTVGVIQVLKEDDFGLYNESKIGRNSVGKNYLLAVEDEIIKAHSFAYEIIKSYKKDGIQYITEVNMSEGSGLQNGIMACNPNTPIIGMKSLQEMSDIEKVNFVFDELKIYQKAWKDGKYTDDFFVDNILPNLQAFTAEANTIIKSVETNEAERITSKRNPTREEIIKFYTKNILI